MSKDVKRFMTLLIAPPAGARESAWCPPADVYRTATGWTVKFDLAGVGREEFEILVQGRNVILRGVRRDWSIEEAEVPHLMEISYSRFERSVSIPCDLERATLVTEYRDGMLLVRLDCSEEP